MEAKRSKGVRAEAVRGVMRRRFGSDQERRRRRSKALYVFEMALRERISRTYSTTREKTSSGSYTVGSPSQESGQTRSSSRSAAT
jgi:uncharacterized membrane protein YccC